MLAIGSKTESSDGIVNQEAQYRKNNDEECESPRTHMICSDQAGDATQEGDNQDCRAYGGRRRDAILRICAGKVEDWVGKDRSVAERVDDQPDSQEHGPGRTSGEPWLLGSQNPKEIAENCNGQQRGKDE